MKKKIAVLTVVIVLGAGVIVFFFQRLQEIMEIQISELVVNSQVLLAETGGKQIKNIFEIAKSEINSAVHSFPLQNLLAAMERNDDEQIKIWKNALVHLFVDYAEAHMFMSQLRFIDSSGQEIARADREKDGKVSHVKILQDKSKEFYFPKAMSIESNQFYLSPITLNREFGKIEIPHREMIRLAMPVMYNKQKKGIIIMNIGMNAIYNIVDNLSEHATLFDSSGKLLNCSIDLPQEYHNKVIERISQIKEDRFHLPLDYYHETGEKSLVGFSPVKILDQKWYVASELPFDEISDIMSKSNRIRVILFVIILIFFTSVLVYFYKLYGDRQRAELKAEMADDLLKLNKQLEQKSKELETANRSLEEIDKRKTDFLNMVAHDLRTPLTSIRSYSDLLLRYGHQSSKSRDEYAEIIKKESIRLSDLIDDFLDISKIEAGLVDYNREEFDIKEMINHFVKLFQGEGEAHQITINCEVAKDLALIYGDKERLGQVFSNLLSNSVKFTRPGGSIKIKASNITINENGVTVPYIQISVSDTGVGIPQKSLGKVFEKFVQISHRDFKATRGTGLGLTITKEIIEQHGGKIKVESEEGKGTKFTFTLEASGKKKESLVIMN